MFSHTILIFSGFPFCFPIFNKHTHTHTHTQGAAGNNNGQQDSDPSEGHDDRADESSDSDADEEAEVPGSNENGDQDNAAREYAEEVSAAAMAAAVAPGTARPHMAGKDASRAIDDKHCGDIYIPNFYGQGQGVVLDVTVTDAQREVNVRFPKAGGATARAEQHKHSKYDDMYKSVGIKFIPFAFDSNGAIGKEADFFLKQLAYKAVDRNPDMEGAAPALRAGWIQKCSLTVQREHVRNMFDLLGKCRGQTLGPDSVFGLDTPSWYARSIRRA